MQYSINTYEREIVINMTNEEFKEKYYELLDNQIDDRIKLNQALEKNAEIMQLHLLTPTTAMRAWIFIPARISLLSPDAVCLCLRDLRWRSLTGMKFRSDPEAVSH